MYTIKLCDLPILVIFKYYVYKNYCNMYTIAMLNLKETIYTRGMVNNGERRN